MQGQHLTILFFPSPSTLPTPVGGRIGAWPLSIPPSNQRFISRTSLTPLSTAPLLFNARRSEDEARDLDLPRRWQSKSLLGHGGGGGFSRGCTPPTHTLLRGPWVKVTPRMSNWHNSHKQKMHFHCWSPTCIAPYHGVVVRRPRMTNKLLCQLNGRESRDSQSTLCCMAPRLGLMGSPSMLCCVAPRVGVRDSHSTLCCVAPLVGVGDSQSTLCCVAP